MVEPEVAYMDLEGDMDLAEDFIVEIVAKVLSKHEQELKSVLERDVEALRRVQKPFPRITYTQAIESIQKTGHPIRWGDDLAATRRRSSASSSTAVMCTATRRR